MVTSILQVVRGAARCAAVVAALAAVSPAAFAQPHKPSAAAMASANELIKVTGATTLFSPLIAGVVEQAKILFLQQNPALSKDVNEVAQQLRKEYAPRFSELTTHVATLYATHFTEPELKKLLAFYESPVGKKLLQQQPAIVNASMKYAQDWANKLSEQVIARMREELKKRGHTL
ncbi:MAG TPA: DUF2059 domain-containing protein [Pseudolabrys sp.]|nr:DUF2059 domain-containing protein [Pseudolabrys sp.]